VLADSGNGFQQRELKIEILAFPFPEKNIRAALDAAGSGDDPGATDINRCDIRRGRSRTKGY
jgi:hypothetical protein